MTIKKALLITVSSDEIKKIRRARYIKFQQCTMPYLAAFSPADWEVVHIDEEQHADSIFISAAENAEGC